MSRDTARFVMLALAGFAAGAFARRFVEQQTSTAYSTGSTIDPKRRRFN